MPLTDRQEKKLVGWCVSRGMHAVCPMCGQNNWSAGEIIAPRLQEDEAIAENSRRAAMVQILCDNCRLVMLFDAAVLESDE